MLEMINLFVAESGKAIPLNFPMDPLGNTLPAMPGLIKLLLS